MVKFLAVVAAALSFAVPAFASGDDGGGGGGGCGYWNVGTTYWLDGGGHLTCTWAYNTSYQWIYYP